MWYNDKIDSCIKITTINNQEEEDIDNVDITEDDYDCRHFHEMI